MAKKVRLTARMADGWVKTITSHIRFTHFWRIVAVLENGRTEVFWGHAKSLADAEPKRAPAADAARQRGWQRFDFEVVGLERDEP